MATDPTDDEKPTPRDTPAAKPDRTQRSSPCGLLAGVLLEILDNDPFAGKKRKHVVEQLTLVVRCAMTREGGNPLDYRGDPDALHLRRVLRCLELPDVVTYRVWQGRGGAKSNAEEINYWRDRIASLSDTVLYGPELRSAIAGWAGCDTAGAALQHPVRELAEWLNRVGLMVLGYCVQRGRILAYMIDQRSLAVEEERRLSGSGIRKGVAGLIAELEKIGWSIMQNIDGALLRVEDIHTHLRALPGDAGVWETELAKLLRRLHQGMAVDVGMLAYDVTFADVPTFRQDLNELKNATNELLGALGDKVTDLRSVALPAAAEREKPETGKLLTARLEKVKADVALERPATIDRAPITLRDEERTAYRAERTQLQKTAGRKAPQIIGESDAILRAWHEICAAARDDNPVLILGETGTGKELCANMVHYTSARKAKEPLIKNCAAFSEDVLISELFGHQRGAYTGADKKRLGAVRAAEGSTLILDEFFRGKHSSGAVLNRLLEQREVQPVGETKPVLVDTRIVAVTNCEEGVPADVKARFCHIIVMPPLCVRQGDIRLLAQHFARMESCPLEEDELAEITAKDYQLNVRGVQREVKRIVAERMPASSSTSSKSTRKGRPKIELTKDQIEDALGGKRTVRDAALALGVSEDTLQRRMKEMDIPSPT